MPAACSATKPASGRYPGDSFAPGLDPDDVILRDPAEWSRILEEARPVVVHVMETWQPDETWMMPK
jgi:hypothetical protein